MDRIERDILIAAPIERVWAVITEPEHVGVWFGNGAPARVDLRPGGTLVLDHGDHGELAARIEKLDEPRYLAYRWLDAESTLVELSLAEEDGSTRLRLVESGFAGLAPARYEANTAGWAWALDELRTYAQNPRPDRIEREILTQAQAG
jgi:uncharacterized protein YndB with AHSA1/START domain